MSSIAPTPATPEGFDAWLTQFGYDVDANDRQRLLDLSFAFLSTLEFCVEGDTATGQFFIAFAIAQGQFDPVSTVSDKELVEKGLGDGGIEKRWQINDALAGTEPVALLRRVPMAYGSLKSMLCRSTLTESAGISNFEVSR